MDITIEQLLYGGYSLSVWHIEHAEKAVGIGAELWCKGVTSTAEGVTVAEAIDNVVRQLLAPEQTVDEALRQKEEE